MDAWILVGEKSRSLKDIDKFINRFKAKGINMQKISVEDIAVLFPCEKDSVFLCGKKTKLPPFVMSAYFGNINEHSLAVSHMLEGKDTLAINSARCIASAADKLKTYITVSTNLPQISVPKTMLWKNTMTEEFISENFSYPLILKINHGSKGNGVELVSSYDELLKTAEELKKIFNDSVLIQQYIAASRGIDIRLILCGGKFITAFRRTNSTSFKSNLSEGGKIEFITPPPFLAEAAEKTGALLDMNIGSIDFLSDGKGSFIFCEANAMPGNSYSEAAQKAGIADPFDAVISNIAQQILARQKAL
jgi:RimK family alpha-L-glutamate ligase